MGMQIAHKLTDGGHSVVAHNRSPEPIQIAAGFGATPAITKQDVIRAFQDAQPVIWLMVPAEVVDTELTAWLEILPKDSVIIDGGNTNFHQTQVHAQIVKDHGSSLIDVGTSGGILGFDNGFSMMVGGTEQVVRKLAPVFETLASPHGSWKYFGPSGAGHFVKMVHNAIEYGVMESLAEGYRILKEGPYQNLNLGDAAHVWQHGSIVESALNGLAEKAFMDNPKLDGVDGYVAESGEARWTLETAKEAGIPAPAIQAAFDVRLASQTGTTSFATKVLAELRNKFGGHALNKQ
jgi:6-phosphogluconate dehydrogenase